MKRKIYIALSLVLFFVSCYNDDSTQMSTNLDIEIKLDQLGDQNSITQIANGHELNLSPAISTGLNTDQFKYEWRLGIYNQNSKPSGQGYWELEDLYETIGTEKDLKQVPVFRTPDPVPYNLWLAIKDERTGAEFNSMWRLQFLSSSGDGILIADTYDNQTSDITLIRSKNISNNYKGEVFYKRNVIEGYSGIRLNEIIHTLYYGPSGNSRSENIFILTENDLKLLDRETYQEVVPIEKLFVSPMPSVIKPKAITKNSTNTILINQDNIHLMNSNSNQFGEPENYVRPGSTTPKKIANKYLTAYSLSYGPMLFFDNTNKIFTFYNIQGTFKHTPDVKNNYSDDLKAYEVIGSGISTDGKHLFLLKNSLANVLIFRIELEENYDIGGGLEPVVKERFETETCPEIANAFQYEVAENRDVVFYTTKSNVYSAYLSGVSATGTVRFTPPAGEEITCIKIFREAWHKINPENTNFTEMDQNQNQLIVATYNNSKNEGKIYVLPITGVNGALGQPVETFDGFGKVTAIDTQGQ